jgi:hypothetical protein
MARLYARDGVEVALIGLEVWSGGVIVRLAGLPSEQSERLEHTYDHELEAWGRTGREGSPPKQPAERLFDVGLALSDDVATSYALRFSSLGGSGSLLRCAPSRPLSLGRPNQRLVSLSLSLVKGAMTFP